MKDIHIYQGNFIDTPEPKNFRVREHHYAVVQDGILLSCTPKLPKEYASLPVDQLGPGIAIPSFIDLHVHAPQHMQMGMGLDLGLLEWLDTHTFPGESRYASAEYARQLYPVFAAELKARGSLRAVVYGTIHLEGSVILAESLASAGLSAFVGKVNMDRNSPDNLREERAASVADTLAFISRLAEGDHPDIRPILTPRFVPSCTPGLMEDMGKLAAEKNLPVQSHLSETIPEAEWVSQLHPESESYTHVYDQFGLLTSSSLMAHGIYLNMEELELIANNGATLVHCPSANINLSSGIMPLSRYLDAGIKLGLGTDVGAGHTMAMNTAIAQAVQVSKLLRILEPGGGHRAVLLSESFYLATVGNGKYFAQQGLGASGAFEPGMRFDALTIDMQLPEAVGADAISTLERFLYAGDDRNITRRFLAGRELV